MWLPHAPVARPDYDTPADWAAARVAQALDTLARRRATPISVELRAAPATARALDRAWTRSAAPRHALVDIGGRQATIRWTSDPHLPSGTFHVTADGRADGRTVTAEAPGIIPPPGAAPGTVDLLATLLDAGWPLPRAIASLGR